MYSDVCVCRFCCFHAFGILSTKRGKGDESSSAALLASGSMFVLRRVCLCACVLVCVCVDVLCLRACLFYVVCVRVYYHIPVAYEAIGSRVCMRVHVFTVCACVYIFIHRNKVNKCVYC